MPLPIIGSYDIQVVVQALIYLVIAVFGFAISIPVGITVNEFENKCILYTDVSWKNSTFFTYQLSSPTLCNFPVGCAVFTCIFYGLGMGIYNLYAACRTKDPNVGYDMWVMPFIMANSLVAILLFVISCMISVGLKETCDGLLGGDGHLLKKCSDAQKINWNILGNTHVNASHFYTFIKASEAAAWITFLMWLVIVALYILRFIRIRRYRAKDMGTPEVPAGARIPEDASNFASANPSA